MIMLAFIYFSYMFCKEFSILNQLQIRGWSSTSILWSHLLEGILDELSHTICKEFSINNRIFLFLG